MAKPKNALAPKNVNILKSLAEHPNPVQYLMQLASEQQGYTALQDYLTSRSAMPPVSFGYLGQGNTGEFKQRGFFSDNKIPETGKVTLNYGFLKPGYNPTNAIPTLTHELTHAAQKEMENQKYQKNINDLEAKQQFLDAYKKIMYDKNKRNRDAFSPNVLAAKLNPEWTNTNEDYRASYKELPAWAMGFVANTNPLATYDTYNTPAHLNPTLATEYEILLDLATKDAKANPNKKAR